MDSIILYSNGCPQCLLLENKLKAKNISYVKNSDFTKVISAGLRSAPALEVNGEMKDFRKAVEWVAGL